MKIDEISGSGVVAGWALSVGVGCIWPSCRPSVSVSRVGESRAPLGHNGVEEAADL